jgi:hypothetical protein
MWLKSKAGSINDASYEGDVCSAQAQSAVLRRNNLKIMNK